MRGRSKPGFATPPIDERNIIYLDLVQSVVHIDIYILF